ncbi:ABC transporter ATP-binding protein [Yinghuangia seranimata]|uniref:ABC transporter ATP-binding protein n=1 Tax=Yinghuangia seranimata TaxID=408067 RepID=UPI00248BB8DB|nr:ABC transporter ATP-binding protein [Yinghuangia seranimata]MDI2124738.1 ABC transporter ATP-binding protein [Yinghuangia seranimata]
MNHDAPSPSAAEPLLNLRGYTVHLNSPRGTVRAVDGVDVAVARGRTLAVVGESGSGKSVLCRSLLGLLPDAAVALRAGTAHFDGVDLTALGERELRDVRGRRVGMVFQDPMTALNPVLPVWRQIALPLKRHLGLRGRAAKARAVELLDSVGIPDPARRADQYPLQLSGGMRQRVMIALALSCDPELLIADEPTTALDVTVQAQILRLLDRLRAERDMAVILISHDLGVVADHSDDVMVMYAGRQAELGPTASVLAAPRMPYTRALLDAAPTLHGPRGQHLAAIGGQPPDMSRLLSGCAFADRCPRVQDRCRTEVPAMTRPPGSAHEAACWNPVPPPRPGGGTVTGISAARRESSRT